MKLLRLLIVPILMFSNGIVPMEAAATATVAKVAEEVTKKELIKQAVINTAKDFAIKYAINQVCPSAIYVYDGYNMYQIFQSSSVAQARATSANLIDKNNIYQIHVQDILYQCDGILMKQDGTVFVPDENTYVIKNNTVHDLVGNQVDAATFVAQRDIRQFNIINGVQDWLRNHVRVGISANSPKKLPEHTESISGNFKAYMHTLSTKLFQLIDNPEKGIYGRKHGLHNHLVDYSTLSSYEQHQYNIFTKYLNKIHDLIYDQHGKFIGKENINSMELAYIYVDFLYETHGITFANFIINTHFRNHSQIVQANRARLAVKQTFRSFWSSLKHIVVDQESPNLDLQRLNIIKNNVYNQSLAQVLDLYERGSHTQALSVGKSNGIFRENPGLEKKIIRSVERDFCQRLSIGSPSGITKDIIEELAAGKTTQESLDLMRALSIDNTDISMQHAYKSFFDEKGIFRLLPYNEQVLDGIRIPNAINSKDFIEQRMLLNKYLALSTQEGVDVAGIQQAIKYLCASMSSSEYAADYFTIAQAALRTNYYQDLHNFGDLSAQLATSDQQVFQSRLINLVSSILHQLDVKSNDLLLTDRNVLDQVLVSCQTMYDKVLEGDIGVASFIFVKYIATPLAQFEEFSDFKDLLHKNVGDYIEPLIDYTDMMRTSAHNYTYNISPEVDRYLEDIFEQLKDEKYNDFDEFAKRVELLLTINDSIGKLKPEQLVSPIEYAGYIMHLMKVAGTECYSRLDPKLISEAITSYIKEIVPLSVDFVLATGCLLEYGSLDKNIVLEDGSVINIKELMPTRLHNRVDMVEHLWAHAPELMQQFEQLSAEDKVRVITRVMTDVLIFDNMLEAAALLKSGKFLAKLEEGTDKFANALRRGMNVTRKEAPVAVTAEGAAIKIGQKAGQTSSLFENTTDQVVGGAGWILDQEVIAKRTREILAHIYEPLQNLAKYGKRIKSVGEDAFKPAHTFFTRDRLNGGIMNLGKTEEEIAVRFIEIIKQVDHKNLLQEGTNPIWTHLNGYKVEIRVHIKDSHVLSINAFPGHSPRNATKAIRI